MKKLYFLAVFFLLVGISNKSIAQYHYLGSWDVGGAPNYLATPDSLTSGLQARIYASLPANVSILIDHANYLDNTVPTYLHLLDSCDVYMTFVGKISAAFQNSLGFYTFPWGNPPAVVPDSAITIVYPSCTDPGFDYISWVLYGSRARVHLGRFPANTGFGFFLVANGWNGTTSSVDTGYYRFYSNNKLNPEADSSLKRHVVILFDSISRLNIVSIEDLNRTPTITVPYICDNDFNDAIVYLTGCSLGSFDTSGFPKTTIPVDSVTSGNTGGLESESLCGAVTRRDYNRIKNGIDTKINYAHLPVFEKNISAVSKNTGFSSSSSLAKFFPSSLRTCDGAYVTTPEDLTTLTIAKDVLSVDYTQKTTAKAVVLGVTTTQKVYNHTKSICDRFRGASLKAVEPVNISGYDFIRYTMQQPDGTPEYTIAFDASKKYNRNSFYLQTSWLISHYEGDDSVFNFQVWASQPDLTYSLVMAVLQNLKSIMPVTQIDDTNYHTPPAFVVNGVRNNGAMNGIANNTTNTTNAYIAFDVRANEETTDNNLDSVTYKVDLAKGGKAPYSLPVNDNYEYQGYFYLNNKLVDEVYFADGAWSIDYEPSLTQLSYAPINEPNRVYPSNEYPVYRGVNIQETSKDYTIATKFITSGDAAVDLTTYRSVKFWAQGTGLATVKLLKNGITNWKDQYETTITLNPQGQNYAISFHDFVAPTTAAPFTPNDITAVVYSFVFNGVNTNLNFTAKTIAFSTDSVPPASQLQSKTLTVAPNPNNGTFQCQFVSDLDRTMQIVFTDATGRQVYKQNVYATTGINNIAITLPNAVSGLLLVHLGNNDVKYGVQKLTVAK